MTAIAATSYYGSGTSYLGSAKAKTASADDTFADVSKNQGTGIATETATSTGSDGSEATVDSRSSTVTAMFKGQLVTLSRIENSQIKRLGYLWEAPEEDYQRTVKFYQMILEAPYRQEPEMPDLSNYPAIKPYATVVAGGQVVATIDNQGVVGSSDALATRLSGQLPDSLNGTNGPDLAQARAEKIAKLLGGRIVKSDTAMTQSQFDALPALPSRRPTVDYEAMKNDPMYEQIQNLKQKRAEYLARQQTGIA